jgi:hypothetical protein
MLIGADANFVEALIKECRVGREFLMSACGDIIEHIKSLASMDRFDWPEWYEFDRMRSIAMTAAIMSIGPYSTKPSIPFDEMDWEIRKIYAHGFPAEQVV